MPGYRFCRSDDIPLLVAAHNACWVPHFGSAEAITVEDFKRGVRELGLWSSSCMVAFEGDEPIGVLIAAKRDGEANYVWRLAVKPGWERRGHGRHLLTSLADKAKILGPPRVVTEVPAEWAGVRRFFERSGFVADAAFREFVRAAADAVTSDDDPRASLVVSVSLEELVESAAFDAGVRRPWARSLASLRARVDRLQALAIVTDRVEAYVVHAPPTGEVVAFGAVEAGAAPVLLGLLLARVPADAGDLRVTAVTDEDAAVLAALGFRRVRETAGYAVERGRS